jgi:aminoglycoside phosphotransferase (APT) family kinase protein
MGDPRRSRPPEQALRWVTESLGAGSRITSVRRLTAGGWSANHALAVVDRAGAVHRLVLRRWARPEWSVEDPDFGPAREAAVLELLAGSPVPAPRLVAADPDGAACDVPALLISRLPGSTPGLPRDMAAFLAQLAGTLCEIHAVDGPTRDRIPAYRAYYDAGSVATPDWSRRPELWERAREIAAAGPPRGPRCFIHRDYHPENTLWSRGRLTGVVDWTSGSWGPPGVDVGHMRWNLALTYGTDAADEFLRALGPRIPPDQPYWDVVGVLDVVPELDAADWPRFDLERLERYLEGVFVNFG